MVLIPHFYLKAVSSGQLLGVGRAISKHIPKTGERVRNLQPAMGGIKLRGQPVVMTSELHSPTLVEYYAAINSNSNK